MPQSLPIKLRQANRTVIKRAVLGPIVPAVILSKGQVFTISGIARDSAGVALPGCIVDLFRVLDKTGPTQPPLVWVQRQTADPTTAAFAFSVSNGQSQYQIVAYLAGAPDRAGATLNTLVGA